MFAKLKALIFNREPKKQCKNCFYFASSVFGWHCMRVDKCITHPKPNGFCPLFESPKQPTRDQVVREYLESCLQNSAAEK